MFALEIVERIRDAVAEEVQKNGPSDDDDFEQEVAWKAWKAIAADPEVKEQFAAMAKNL